MKVETSPVLVMKIIGRKLFRDLFLVETAFLQVFKENKHVIFTGNGYSAEWPVEASKRGLPNLNTTPKAIATWNSERLG